MSDGHADAIERIAALLPQTQCRRCGFAGCLPYARAIVSEGASIALCPPGGHSTYAALAQEVGMASGGPAPDDEPLRVAFVVEADCIGCTRCIQACPVDAISGAAGHLHTVVQQWCTGCDLCRPVCPTDCIEMHVVATDAVGDPAARAASARARYEARQARPVGAGDTCGARLIDVATTTPAELRVTIEAALRRRQARTRANPGSKLSGPD